MNDYKLVIGLEIHVELNTKSKMFCQCSANYFGKEPNTNTCPVCLGMPGALPVPNNKAIESIIKIGKALNCKINHHSKFDRKHYFYPDLPKGYQISQYDEPIALSGELKITNPKTLQEKVFRLTRVHMEEDTGKLIHQQNETLVDFNRSGVPLVEIVTEPDFDNAEDVKMFLEELHAIIVSLGVSDADMEKGSMRLEPNISVKKAEEKELPKYKVEVKNINSFNFVKKAIEYELQRQVEVLEKGELPAQETRGYDEKTATTYSQRAKEEAHDYRYFPEPDIPPMNFSDDFINNIPVPELPQKKTLDIVNNKVKMQDAFIIARNSLATSYYYELTDKLEKDKDKFPGINIPQTVANLIVNKKIDLHISVSESYKQVKEQLTPKKTDLALLDECIEKVLANNSKVVTEFKSGKQNAIMFLVGQVMKEMKGQADANVVRETLTKKLTTS